eukprot:TRINITY_DN30745_c0_g1_i3.p1 TRINITY_DN30745_c0_g1~~TRINITY_DN30745_c0_g1_i3.p1  ORF type:complete len:253 (-),score=85.30 TRINITY_DN30745_c0_g1_i3:157-915(-)
MCIRDRYQRRVHGDNLIPNIHSQKHYFPKSQSHIMKLSILVSSLLLLTVLVSADGLRASNTRRLAANLTETCNDNFNVLQILIREGPKDDNLMAYILQLVNSGQQAWNSCSARSQEVLQNYSQGGNDTQNCEEAISDVPSIVLHWAVEEVVSRADLNNTGNVAAEVLGAIEFGVYNCSDVTIDWIETFDLVQQKIGLAEECRAELDNILDDVIAIVNDPTNMQLLVQRALDIAYNVQALSNCVQRVRRVVIA